MTLPLYVHSPIVRAQARVLLEVGLARYEAAHDRLADVERRIHRLVGSSVRLSPYETRELHTRLRAIRQAVAKADRDLDTAIDLFISAHLHVADVWPVSDDQPEHLIG